MSHTNHTYRVTSIINDLFGVTPGLWSVALMLIYLTYKFLNVCRLLATITPNCTSQYLQPVIQIKYLKCLIPTIQFSI